MPFRVRDRDERRHVVIVVEQHVHLHSALGSPVFRPRKERQAEADRGRIEGEELVLEAEFRLSVPQASGRAEVVVQSPEEILEESGGTMGVCVGESGTARRLLQPDVGHLPVAAGQAVYYLAK